MRSTSVVAIANILALALAFSAYAGGSPDAARPIISENCVACHDVPGFKAKYGRADVNAPPFQSIADRPEIYSDEQMRRFLRQPHFPMEKFVLSSTDLDDIIAFIKSLRHQ
jgi:hypothetical protein